MFFEVGFDAHLERHGRARASGAGAFEVELYDAVLETAENRIASVPGKGRADLFIHDLDDLFFDRGTRVRGVRAFFTSLGARFAADKEFTDGLGHLRDQGIPGLDLLIARDRHDVGADHNLLHTFDLEELRGQRGLPRLGPGGELHRPVRADGRAHVELQRVRIRRKFGGNRNVLHGGSITESPPPRNELGGTGMAVLLNLGDVLAGPPAGRGKMVPGVIEKADDVSRDLYKGDRQSFDVCPLSGDCHRSFKFAGCRRPSGARPAAVSDGTPSSRGRNFSGSA